MRRVAWRLLPLLMLCYFAAYLDRVNVSFAALQMNPDLGLDGAAYGLGAGLFFVTYCLLEVPSNLLLVRLGASRWIARILFTWGLCAAAMALVHSRSQFYGMRLLLGAAEAGFYPGVLYYLTSWFPARYRGRMLGLFLTAIPLSGIIGAPFSGYLLSLDGMAGVRGWRWLYLIEALPAILLAPAVWRWLPAGPAAARWLPADERDWLVERLAAEERRVATHGSHAALRALTNPGVLLLAAAYFTNVCLLNGITFFLPQILAAQGSNSVTAGFLVAIPNALALAALIWWGRRSDRTGERYGHAALANLLGGALLLAAVLLRDPAGEVAAISCAFACTLAFTSPFWAIPGTFLTGAGAAGGIAAISSIGVTGGLLAPWFVGMVRDATGSFRTGLGAIGAMTLAVSVLFYAVGRARQTQLRRSEGLESLASTPIATLSSNQPSSNP